ncbi:hypothetical protein GCM10009801_42680 [Streptomyces albiaxialis]|uniref:AB hydrolase-1 domain-containing protein n=1 Tax=Streptomyces albiaxialis TaxID=329523 RepID=A0ABP5HN10_9ACTN
MSSDSRSSSGFTRMTLGALAAAGAVGVTYQLYADARAKRATGGLAHRQLTCSSGNIISYHVREGAPGADTLVLDAGLLSSSLAWLLVLDHLDPDLRVVLYDRAGYRRSLRRCAEDYCFEESVGDLVDVLGEAVDGDCVLAGHSLGGYLAHRAATRLPETVRGLVLIDPMHPRQLRESRTQRAGANNTNLTVRLAPLSIQCGGALLLDRRSLLSYADDSPYRRALGWELSSASAWRASRREWGYAYAFMLDGGRPLDALEMPVSVLAAEATVGDAPEQRALYEEYARSGADGGSSETLAGASHLSILGSAEHAPRTAAHLEKALAATHVREAA